MWKKRIALILGVLLLGGASYVLGWSNLLTVSQVTIVGTPHYLQEYVTVGEKLARIEPRVIAAKYESIDFIKEAKVSRNWVTRKVTISITERIPKAIFNTKLVDSDGKEFAQPAGFTTQLPVINANDSKSVLWALSILDKLPLRLIATVENVTVESDDSFRLDMKFNERTIQVRWGSVAQSALKAKVYQALIALPENSKINWIDLSAPHAPIVK